MIELIDPRKLLTKVVRILNDLDLQYFITGGFALSVWGKPRSTLDIDIVIRLIEPQIELLAKALRKISRAGYIDEDAAKEAIRRKGEFNFIDSETGVKIDFWLMTDGVALREYKRSIVKEFDGERIYFISPEDLILNKLLWYEQSQSSRHLEDIESVLKSCGKNLDMKYLKQWAEKLNVLGMFKALLKK